MIRINDMPKPWRQGLTLARAFRENDLMLKGGFLIYVNEDLVDVSEYETFELQDEDDIQTMFTFFMD